jgi:hypothetical protein
MAFVWNICICLEYRVPITVFVEGRRCVSTDPQRLKAVREDTDWQYMLKGCTSARPFAVITYCIRSHRQP